MENTFNIKKKFNNKITKWIRKDLLSWIVILPSLILFAFFVWEPLISNVRLSFYKTSNFDAVNFVFFDNYIAVLEDKLFLYALTNTLLYTFFSLVIGFLVPIFLAILVSELVHFKGFIKSALYIPNMIPGLAAVLVWTVMMDPNPSGFFNIVLNTLHLPTYEFLGNREAVIPLIILTMTWKGAGATMLIYLASIQTIDNSYYEAARLEGAGFFDRIRYVLLPAIIPNIKLLLIMQIISVFQVFFEPFAMTGGGPNYGSLSLTQLIYTYAFEKRNAGMSSALGVIVSLALLILSSLYFYLESRGKKRV